jgi:hypothetical protein
MKTFFIKAKFYLSYNVPEKCSVNSDSSIEHELIQIQSKTFNKRKIKKELLKYLKRKYKGYSVDVVTFKLIPIIKV